MKILSPIDDIAEVAPLCDAGADALYGGVIPDAWSGGERAVNRRTFAGAQFDDEETFAVAVQMARERGVDMHLTLNAPLYAHDAYGELLELARRAATWGVSRLIVADLGLLLRLSTAQIGVPVTLSTMAGAMNRHSLKMFQGLGVASAVFPRHLTLGEMSRMAGHVPGLELEAFVLIGKCPNEEAFCTFQHISPQKRWPCEIPYTLHPGASAMKLDDAHMLSVREAEWSRVDRRMACGLCGIDQLRRMGVKVLKLVGRGGPTRGKVANVELVRSFIEAEKINPVDARKAYRERFGRACVKEICYFPELF